MGELQRDEKVGVGLMTFAVALLDGGEKLRQAFLTASRGQQLVRVGPTLCHNSDRFPAPDQLRPTFAEPPPASQQGLGGTAVGCGIPSFHGVNAPAVANSDPTYSDRLCKW
jgi:hypothetical protein